VLNFERKRASNFPFTHPLACSLYHVRIVSFVGAGLQGQKGPNGMPILNCIHSMHPVSQKPHLQQLSQTVAPTVPPVSRRLIREHLGPPLPEQAEHEHTFTRDNMSLQNKGLQSLWKSYNIEPSFGMAPASRIANEGA
jgi:hypothetical protein